MTVEPLNILVIDDSEDYVELCHDFLPRYRYLTNCDFSHPCWECDLRSRCRLKHAHDWSEAEEILQRHGGRADVVLLDVHFDLPADRLLPAGDREEARADRAALKRMQTRQGFHILEALRQQHSSLPVVLMTSKRMVAADEPGLLAQLEGHRFTEMLGDEGVNAQSLAARIESFGRLKRVRETEGRFFWGRSGAMQRLRNWLEIFSEGDQPILILGETGTGKSYLAEHFIHQIARPDGPFCALDLSAIPDNLVAAELFGTSRGAFSDAVDRAGRFEFANGGTLFLDEIGNLTPDTQKRLLGVLQDRRVTRLGENRSRPIDVKLIVATNEDLEARVRTGSFRADLYQRLNPAAKVEIPPLRERLEDLAELLQVLTDHIFESPGNRRLLDRLGALFGQPAGAPARVIVGALPKRRRAAGVVLHLGGAAERVARSAAWPGNIRQLELVWTNAVTFQLVEQIAAGRIGDSPVIGMDSPLLQELIASSSLDPTAPADAAAEPERVVVDVPPCKTLNETSRVVEAQYFKELYVRSGERFEKMAEQLLLGEPAKNARRVQLRFNNLGLSTRKIRGR